MRATISPILSIDLGFFTGCINTNAITATSTKN